MGTATLERPADIVGDDELYEVIDGIRVRNQPMAAIAGWIASRLVRLLGNFADEELGHVVSELLFHLPDPLDRDRRPDVAFVSYQRWAKNRQIPVTGNAWDVVPDLAVEVVSPTDKADDIEEKIAEYFQAGVQLVWVVFPQFKKIHVYSSPTRISMLSKGETLDGGLVVPGFRLPLTELFPDMTEPATPNVTSTLK